MKKLIVVYNSGSSQHRAVEREVLSVVRKLQGWMVGKFEVKGLDLDTNAKRLAELLNDGDLLVAAGGDGTAAIAVNGVMLSGKDVAFSALGYGNFNDIAHMLKTKRPVEYGDEFLGGISDLVTRFGAGEVEEIFPLEILVDGEHWRYALSYVTIGLFAESTKVFDEKKVRHKLKNGRHFPAYSWWTLAKWYFRNHKKQEFLPRFELNGSEQLAETTDYIAVNGTMLADVMRGGDWYLDKKVFGSGAFQLRSFWNLCKFMMKSIFVKVPVVDTEKDVLEFGVPASMEIQAEGEYQRLENVTKIEVKKARKGLKVVKGQ